MSRRRRTRIVTASRRRRLPTEIEVLTLIDSMQLFGFGIGYVDAHLLAATMLTADARLWQRDH